MSCIQSAVLIQHGIRIDNFVLGLSQTWTICVSHAHKDHVKHISPTKMRRARIACTQTTFDLLRIDFPYLQAKHHIPLSFYKETEICANVSVMTLPAYHCAGSSMFVFSVGSGQTIMYTNDFRYNPSVLSYLRSWLGGRTVDELYYDDIFEELSDNLSFPSLSESVDQLVHVVSKRLRVSTAVEMYWSVLGVESLLLALVQQCPIPFRYDVHATLTSKDAKRVAQLKYLIPGEYFADEAWSGPVVYLSSERTKRGVKFSCTSLMCRGRRPTASPYTVYFCMHSSKEELDKVLDTVQPERAIACQYRIRTLKCNS